MFDFFKKKDKKEEKVNELNIYAMCDGDFVEIENVKDEVFAQKMMGDGFAIKPANGSITSPVDGKVDNIFPAKHAISLLAQDVEVLLHMGIDTVSLDGRPFTISTKAGAEVNGTTNLAEVDLNQLKEDGKDDVMIVIFTNGSDTIESIEYTTTGQVKQGDVIGKITLK